MTPNGATRATESTPASRDSEAVARPGFLKRMLAGAFHVPAGFVFLLRRPRLWPLALLPMLIAALLIAAGASLGIYTFSTFESALVPPPDRVPGWLALLMMMALGVSVVIAGMIIGLALALFLSAPILDRLSRRVEAIASGDVNDQLPGLRWEIAQSLRGALFFMAIAPFIFILGLMPVIGPVLGGLWGAWALTFQQTEPTLTRRGLSFAARREWHRFWRAESYGFGLVGLLVLLIPLLQFALTSVLTVGATLMVLELEAIAPSAPNPQGVVSPRP